MSRRSRLLLPKTDNGNLGASRLSFFRFKFSGDSPAGDERLIRTIFVGKDRFLRPISAILSQNGEICLASAAERRFKCAIIDV